MGAPGRPLRAVVFDLDGVLVDTEPVHFRALRAFVAPAELTAAQYAALVGTSVEHTLGWVREQYGRTEPFEELRRLSSDYVYRELTHAPLVPLEGASELVEAVTSARLPAAVASQSSRRWVQATLRSIGFDRRLPAVVTAEEVAHGKPAPDIYLRAAELLGVPPESCLAIEDSLPGIESALAAGLFTVQLRQTEHAAPPHDRAHAIIESLRDFDLAWLGLRGAGR
jgi:HAD superfamily hydrolase (TIGR01509 family)